MKVIGELTRFVVDRIRARQPPDPYVARPPRPVEVPVDADVIVETPLLGLCMIVKNEAHGITETLKTFRPVIGYWTILDTGSTDGTQKVIHRELAGIPGQLVEEPFVDFSTSRNRALDLHGTRTTFTIMPDSDDRLDGADALRTFLEQHAQHEGFDHEAYLTNIRRYELSYYLPLVTRTTAKRRYKGRVHEYSGLANIQVPGVAVTQQRESKSLEATKARWERDLELLRADHASNPSDPRAVFYLAQTLECLGKREEAIEAYELRIKIGGWTEETFEAMMRRASIMKAIGKPWPEVQQAYLDAHTFDKRRAEPLYAIAAYWYYDAKDNLPLTYLFARRAFELPRPAVTLFVDQDIYDWKAAHLVAIAGYYLEDAAAKEIGERAAERATAKHGSDELIRSNRVFYKRSAAVLFGSRAMRLELELEKPYVASNPSVHFDGQRWRCLVRTLNYRIVDGWSYVPPDGVIQTVNVMVELTPELEVTRAVVMADCDQTSRSNYPVHGFEDCRLFDVDGRFYCTATVCDFTVEGRREIVLCELGENYAVMRATPLRGPWSQQDQKNWMPVLGRAKTVYSLEPTAVLDLDVVKRAASVTGDLPGVANRHLRGGSQLVPFDGGYLCVVHDVTWSGAYRIYTHRFVWLDAALIVRKMSDMFYFENRGIEYCCGLAYDGKRLVASYSVNDASANVAIFDPERVKAGLREEFVV